MITIEEKKIEGLYLREYSPKTSSISVLFLHGYPGAQKNYDIAEHLALKGYRVFVMHYRGVWKSEGKYSLLSIYPDVEKILAYIQGLGFSEERIALIGTSWGGFVALEIFARHPNLYKVILLSPFTNIDPDEEKLKKGAEFLYSVTKPAIKNYEKEELLKDLKIVQKEYNPLDHLSKLDGKKVLMIHGIKDQVCPIESTLQLKSKFNGLSRLFQLQDQDHFLHTRELLFEYCEVFLNSSLKEKV